uniref:Transmembrane protein 161B n=1 Tax=Eptatretus burgeri TaxID=7764 RepID=A0A8C4RBL3_EPTBU
MFACLHFNISLHVYFQGVIGVQFVGTMVAFSLLQKVPPHHSFARWLLNNGRLVRYRHPSEEELYNLAGKQLPKGKAKKDKDNGGVAKPLTIPKDLDFQLEHTPVSSVDTLGTFITAQKDHLPTKRPCTRHFWCTLLLVKNKALFVLTKHYFQGEDGGERAVCITFAAFFFVKAMATLVISERFLEFGLETGFSNFSQGAVKFLQDQGIDSSGPISFLTFKMVLAVLCAMIGAFFTFPGLRLAKMHLDALSDAVGHPALQAALHVNFLAPLLVSLLWIKPIARDYLLHVPMGKGPPVQLMSSESFDSARLWAIISMCFLRLLLTQAHMQVMLYSQNEHWWMCSCYVSLQVARVFYYLCVIALQYLAPTILILNVTFLLKSLGGHSWGLYPEPLAADVPVTTTTVGDITPEIAALHGLQGVFTPPFFRGLLSYLTWWLCICWFVTSLYGLFYHKYLLTA